MFIVAPRATKQAPFVILIPLLTMCFLQRTVLVTVRGVSGYEVLTAGMGQERELWLPQSTPALRLARCQQRHFEGKQ